MQRAKDLSKVILNNQDVMIVSKNIKKPSSIIIQDLITDEEKARQEEWEITIVAVGKEATTFKPGDIVMDIKGNRLSSKSLDSTDEYSDRISIIHMNNIEYAVEKENYEYIKEEK